MRTPPTEPTPLLGTSAIFKKLSLVQDPDLGKDIVTLGFVKELEVAGSTVRFTLELTTPACPVKDQLKEQCETVVGELEGVDRVEVTLSAQPRRNPLTDKNQEKLAGVSSIVAISSCKGGVGKSTVSTNLAVALAQSGARVGMLDADIYGPSLPTMLGLAGRGPQVVDQTFIPLEAVGMKVMSAGFLMPQGDAAVMRGPMISNLLQQILLFTEWGELDYLIIDMPPGTGDIQLTLTQTVNLSGALIVTTPQRISLIDVAKGIGMFSKVNVPILGVVENMSYLEQNGQRVELYGPSGTPGLSATYGLDILGHIPFFPEVVAHSDRGQPAAAHHGTSYAKVYADVGERLVREVAKARHDTTPIPNIDIDW